MYAERCELARRTLSPEAQVLHALLQKHGLQAKRVFLERTKSSEETYNQALDELATIGLAVAEMSMKYRVHGHPY